MTLSIYSLLKAGLLVLNALAILHPGRFLRVYGIVENAEDPSAKSRLASTLAWSRGLQCAFCARRFFVILRIHLLNAPLVPFAAATPFSPSQGRLYSSTS